MYFYSGYLLAVFISFMIAILAMFNGFEIYFGETCRLPFTGRRVRGVCAKRVGAGLFLFGAAALGSLVATLIL